MKRSLIMLPIAAMAIVLSGCTTLIGSSYGTSDLYRRDTRTEIALRRQAEAEAERAEAEARRAEWEARQAAAEADLAEAEYYAMYGGGSSYGSGQEDFLSIVADDYQSAYARRLYGFESPTYQLPSSYYDLRSSSAMFYASAYDPAFYNVMVSGNQVWVEPKYVTSMFGSWGATNVTFGLYSSPWAYGYGYYADPFYYSWWGYPRYSWYDWNWTMCYNPYHYDPWCNPYYYDPWCYNYYYAHHGHHGHYNPHGPHGPGHGHNPGPPPPSHRPGHDHVTGPGAGSGPNYNYNGSRGNSGTRYTSPVTDRNYGGTTSDGRPRTGSIASGYNPRESAGRVSTIEGGNRGNSMSGLPAGQGTTRIEGGVNRGYVGGSNGNVGGSNGNDSRGNMGNFRQGGTSSRGEATVGGGNNRGQGANSVGGSTSTRRGSGSVGGSSGGRNNRSGSSGSTYRGGSSGGGNRSGGSGSTYRGGSSGGGNRASGSVGTGTLRGGSSGSSSGSGSYSGGSRSGGGGSTSSRR